LSNTFFTTEGILRQRQFAVNQSDHRQKEQREEPVLLLLRSVLSKYLSDSEDLSKLKFN